ncbi:MAG: beta-ketoacyl-[acyl-carrier-protein] synthase family protein [Myxococcales bacterium]|nr:beta-ketoacyl-[acyl-carrier-protein] synthase family protein [Myxococcales bacterium]
MLPRVFVTGVGVVSSIGLGRTSFFQALDEGRSGISPVTHFDASQLGRQMAGEVKGFDPRHHLTQREQGRMGRCSAMAVAAARMALDDAGLPGGLPGDRAAVVLGTTMGEAELLGELEHDWIVRGAGAVPRAGIPRYGSTLLPIHVARAVGARGMVLTLPAACAAGNYAIGFAADLIRSGRADVVMTGAAELIQQLQFSGFVRLAAMAPERCQPFDLNRQGLLLGEGAGLLVLESEAHAARRGARPQAEIGGYGLSCDAYHITRPHPDATGSVAAMRGAIARSGLAPGDVDFVNAHGTGTKHNDTAESKVMREVFGDRRVPISSMKSMLGHCMGAASALEAIGCIFTLETGRYPPTIGYQTPDPECDVDVVANVTRSGKADVVLNNSLAFGGYNAVVLLARPGVLPPPPPSPDDPPPAPRPSPAFDGAEAAP